MQEKKYYKVVFAGIDGVLYSVMMTDQASCVQLFIIPGTTLKS